MLSFINSYESFLSEVEKTGESIILYAVPRDISLHPCVTECLVVFIRSYQSRKTVSISFHHQDEPNDVSRQKLIDDLSNLKNNKWVFNKKSFIQMLSISNLNDIDLFLHLWKNSIIEKEKHETSAHLFIYSNKRGILNINDSIPLLKHKEMFDSMCDAFVEPFEIDAGYQKENTLVIETLAELESNGVYVNSECFGKHFKAIVQPNGLVYSQYHIDTSTGRPSNNFDEVNYAALNKETGVRQCFSSRFKEDGKMVLIDYAAFHPRIICHLIKFPLAIDVDIYRYLGEMYYKRTITDSDVDEIKKLTFKQLYGGVENQFEHIKYFFRLKAFIKSNWENFERDGFVLTPIFKRRITNSHVTDPNPNKLFNYILQATETEIAVPAIAAVNAYLKDKKTKAVLYTYDSILFDFHKKEGGAVLNDIVTIMKMNERFPIKVYIGETYDEMSQIYP